MALAETLALSSAVTASLEADAATIDRLILGMQLVHEVTDSARTAVINRVAGGFARVASALLRNGSCSCNTIDDWPRPDGDWHDWLRALTTFPAFLAADR